MILSARYIVPIDANFIQDGAILIKGQFIRAVGDKKAIISSFPDEENEDLGEAVIFPGFINAHTHLQYSLVEISSSPISFIEWLPQMIQKSNSLSYEDWEKGTQSGIEKLKKSGITTIADVSRYDASFKELSSTQYNSFIFKEIIAPDEPKINEILDELKEKITQKKDGKIHIGVSPHSLYSLSLPALKRISEFARMYYILLMIHVSETKEEMELIINGTGPLKKVMSDRGLKLEYGYKETPVKILAKYNILCPYTVVVHAANITQEDISLLKQYKTSVVLCPRSNEFLKTGAAPVSDLVHSGVCLGIGTDSLASNKSFDMFEEMRTIKKIYPKIGYKSLLRMATINGANILKISILTGSLTPGKYADINAVKIKNNLHGEKIDPYKYLCEEAQIEDIVLSMAGGRRSGEE
ncbi:MAG: amidohydrolase family protein [Candidatus Firestonebacteria bacterium]|nr:amidohydrolase family protein [Candidatus Firestonebacteria bacterium]